MPEHRRNVYPDFELYNLKDDPKEKINLIETHSEVFNRYRIYMERIIKSVKEKASRLKDTKIQLDAKSELVDQLIQLGYIDAE